MSNIRAYLRELTALPGISSREDPVIKYMYQSFRKYCENISIDTLGNVICYFPSKNPNANKIMVFGHMDEIGFVIRKIEDNGFLRIERVGGVNVNVLPGIKVDVIGERGLIPGVIGVKSHHYMKQDEKGHVPNIDELYIDIGAVSKDQVKELGIQVGCFACFHSEYFETQGGFAVNKAMDNRVACAILIELAEDISKHRDELEWDVYLVACVQEEFNIRGILPVVRKIKPNVSIGIDVTPSCDTPDLKDYSDVVLNGGPALTFLNFHGRGTLAGVLPDERLINRLVEIAEKEKIPFQREIAVGVITENAYILFEEMGISVANLSIPTRYTHTPIETVCIKDIELAEKLIFLLIRSLDKRTSFGKSYLINTH